MAVYNHAWKLVFPLCMAEMPPAGGRREARGRGGGVCGGVAEVDVWTEWFHRTLKQYWFYRMFAIFALRMYDGNQTSFFKVLFSLSSRRRLKNRFCIIYLSKWHLSIGFYCELLLWKVSPPLQKWNGRTRQLLKRFRVSCPGCQNDRCCLMQTSISWSSHQSNAPRWQQSLGGCAEGLLCLLA